MKTHAQLRAKLDESLADERIHYAPAQVTRPWLLSRWI